ncbi:MAG: type III-A CRISPR-associated protein Cas10/Csm1, partial [Candidatus Competibacteraceae bacterium]|nr:type III-A CRISPR-associated protein Cas10/Csm1 [Candidatus Competibacteraceae bacterium]
GRSFYVSLISECAALRVLDELGLPSTSQITNAAGKFLIVAPNTPATVAALERVQQTLNDWFLQYSWGLAGVGLAWLPACGNDFLRRSRDSQQEAPFADLLRRLFAQLETSKLQRYALTGTEAPEAVFSGFLDQFHNEKGVCRVDGRSPATRQQDGIWLGDLAWDQIQAGECLTRHTRLLITRQPLQRQDRLELALFGYHISFTGDETASGKFSEQARNGDLRRAWDFSLPRNGDKPLWNGYARRYINAYIPRFTAADFNRPDKYDRTGAAEEGERGIDEIKTLTDIACEDRWLDENERWSGVRALMTLKGDVDNLGEIFQHGLNRPTFARMAGLSRQLNAFFAIYLPWRCQSESAYQNTYTVFAGGDDFFLIGPWRSQIRLAEAMRGWFQAYVAHNPDIHFSAGLAMTKPGLPIRHLSQIAEEALDSAKQYQGEAAPDQPPAKNAVCCYGMTVSWDHFAELMQRLQVLEQVAAEERLSTGYLYGLLRFTEMQERIFECPENAIWHAWFAYRTRRLLERNRRLSEQRRQSLQQQLGHEIAPQGIERFGERYKISLFTHLYQQRD